jgi:hypothetical protein
VTVSVVLAVSLLTALPSGAQSSGDKPTATEVGVTAKEIHVGTIADVDNPLAPNIFAGARYGAEGAAKYLNSKAGGGGIGGRKVVVDFADSQLNPNKTRNSVITACSNDFAMVGGAVLFLTSVDDITNCPDKAGAATGLPDLPSLTAGVVESCAPTTYGLNPPQLVCSTATDSPQTYRSGAGLGRWLVSKDGKDKLHGPFLYAIDTKDAERGSRAINDAYIATGIKADAQTGVSVSTPESGYTSIVNAMKTDNSNFASGTATLVNEAVLQGITSGVTYVCTCTPKDATSLPDVENLYVQNGSLPFSEASSSPMLKAFLKYVTLDKADNYAIYAWSAMLAFAQAARNVVAKDGVNGLTRSAFLKEGVPTLTKFNAGGIIGTTNIYTHTPSPCFVATTLKNSKFVRAYPTKKGTFDCNPKNLVTTKADYTGG